MKICKDCQVPKLLKQFYRNPTTSDRRDSSCKDCRKAYACEMYFLKRDARVQRKRCYEQSPAGKATRARYLASGGRELYNEARRMNRRIARMDLQRGSWA